MAEKKPNLHKTLLVLVLVFTPAFWLLLTDDGMRVSDTALLWLMGHDEIKLNVQEIDAGFTREDIQTVFHENEWVCGEKETQFGNNVCAAKVGTFNGFPSRLLTVFFRDQYISAFKLIYRDSYHDQIIGYFIQQLGQPANVAQALAEGPDAANVLEWDLGKGVLLMSKQLGEGVEPAVLWLAAGPDSP